MIGIHKNRNVNTFIENYNNF